MMLKLLTALTIFSTSLVVSTEAIFLQGLKHQIMCRIAKFRLQRLGGEDCTDCETFDEFEGGEGYLTSCDKHGYAYFGTDGASVHFKNRQDQYLAFNWEEPGLFGRYGKPKDCFASEGDDFDKLCKCEANLLATPIIPGPLSYQVSDCKAQETGINAEEGMTGIKAKFGGFN